MNHYPVNWNLIEEYDGNYIFENSDKSFCVNIDYTGSCNHPYSISFVQLKGQFILIGYNNGAYSAHAKLLEEALHKTYDMMLSLNSNIGISELDFKKNF